MKKNPAAFDDHDLKRLFWIFLQAVAALFIVLFAIVFSDYHVALFGYAGVASHTCSGLLAFILIWLVSRVVAMAMGDIGFVRLQREVLENANLTGEPPAQPLRSPRTLGALFYI